MAGSVPGAGDFRQPRRDPTPGKKPEAGQKLQDTVRGSDRYVQGATGTQGRTIPAVRRSSVSDSDLLQIRFLALTLELPNHNLREIIKQKMYFNDFLS